MLFHNDVTVRMTKEAAQKENFRIVTELPLQDDGTQYVYAKSSITNIPFLKNNQLDYRFFVSFLGDNASNFLWLAFIPIIIIIVTAVTNGANLTDGVDGLATGVSAIIGATLGIFAYVSSNTFVADYLNILYLPNSAEVVVFAGCFVGACIGFLWHNSFPAKVFMGDTGSLALGGMVAAMAILLRKELLIPIFCGIYFVESLSVILQVSYFKYTRKKYGEGRRIFLMSPLHHHYQKKGIHESQIVIRFWIVGILLAMLSIITLKLQ
jgi:phospho-N-acetylmuramoyl-pentapeptide-transferase